MIHDYLKPLMHYVCGALLLVLVYFLGSSVIAQLHTTTYHGPQVVVTAPTPNAVGKVAQTAADAATNTALLAALQQKDLQLSAAQQTIASAASAFTGATSRMASAFAVGVTQPSPKQQVITIQTKAQPNASFNVPSPGPNDDAIKRDMKEVLATTTVNAKVDTNVNVSYQDKPFSPFSAVYAADGASGAAYTLHSAPALNFDVLGLVKGSALEPGVGLEHVLKGTSAGIGVGATYNMQTHKAEPNAYVSIHF